MDLRWPDYTSILARTLRAGTRPATTVYPNQVVDDELDLGENLVVAPATPIGQSTRIYPILKKLVCGLCRGSGSSTTHRRASQSSQVRNLGGFWRCYASPKSPKPQLLRREKMN